MNYDIKKKNETSLRKLFDKNQFLPVSSFLYKNNTHNKLDFRWNLYVSTDYAIGISTYFDSTYGCTEADDWHVTMTCQIKSSGILCWDIELLFFFRLSAVHCHECPGQCRERAFTVRMKSQNKENNAWRTSQNLWH